MNVSSEIPTAATTTHAIKDIDMEKLLGNNNRILENLNLKPEQKRRKKKEKRILFVAN